MFNINVFLIGLMPTFFYYVDIINGYIPLIRYLPVAIGEIVYLLNLRIVESAFDVEISDVL